jgi:hypothetical protein
MRAYLAYLSSERRVSPHTVRAGEQDLRRLVSLAAERPAASLSTAEIRRFAARLHGAGLASRSIARILSTLVDQIFTILLGEQIFDIHHKVWRLNIGHVWTENQGFLLGTLSLFWGNVLVLNHSPKHFSLAGIGKFWRVAKW